MSYGLFDISMLESMEDDDLMNLSVLDESTYDDGYNSDIFSMNVDSFVESSSGDLLDAPILEEGDEFETKCPSVDFTLNFDADNSKERKIPIPSDEKLDSDTYNQALDQLKKSFKEATELIDVLQDASGYTEDVLFEEVNRSDKEAVRKIRDKIARKVIGFLQGNDVETSGWSFIRSLFLRSTALGEWWSLRFWQTIGVCYAEQGNINDITKEATKEFKDDLGEYKIIATPILPDLWDTIKLKLGWKNQKLAYILLIDKKRPSEN